MVYLPLRELAVTVREHGPCSYFWVLIERSLNGEWEEIALSNDYERSWVDAFDAGIVELNTRVKNELIGPRGV